MHLGLIGLTPFYEETKCARDPFALDFTYIYIVFIIEVVHH